MNLALITRYVTETAILVPTAVIAVLPVRSYLRIKKSLFAAMLAGLLLIAVPLSAVICSVFGLISSFVIFPCMVLLFVPYHLSFSCSMPQKLFCYANAAMLCAFCISFTTVVGAPLELSNPDNVYTLQTGMICLGISLAVTAVFFRTLTIKLPELLRNTGILQLWKLLTLMSAIMTAILIWMNPVSAENVMVGRARPISLVLFLSIPTAILLLYHMLWRTAKQTAETAELQRRYDLLRMVEEQYRKTLHYLQETSDIRHDFRQHILVINELARKGENEKLLGYLSPIIETVGQTHTPICADHTLDAVASHYNYIAQKKNVRIEWAIDISENMPVSSPDLCSVIGNLAENSVKAAEECESADKTVSIRIGMLSPGTLVISATNPYMGSIYFDRNGLPMSDKTGHGIGMRSIANIVDKYKGSMEIETSGNVFNVSIVMYG